MAQHALEVARGERFTFGDNWRSFLSVVSEAHITEAQDSLRQLLGVEDLHGKRFLDIGSGSGLFSLAARRLGAEVFSFDYDPASAASTAELRQRYQPDDADWTVGEGSILDEAFVRQLGQYDVVYSWGVLHHTGRMWQALEHATWCVAPGGSLAIALYNDQGAISNAWRSVKRAYCSGPAGRAAVTAVFMPYFACQAVAASLIRFGHPLRYFPDYHRRRGMSVWHDWKDWLGGYPFEVAKPEEVLDFCRNRGFNLERLATTNRLGCNQFAFRRSADSGAGATRASARNDRRPDAADDTAAA